MAHTGTMDLGQTRKAARGGNPWLAVAVIVGIMAATVGAVWFTSGTGLTTSSALQARPAADRSYDQIEAQRGAMAALAPYQVEQLRNGDSLVFAARSGGLVVDGDHVYDPIDQLRGGSAIVSDHTYDPIEQIRGAVGAAAIGAAVAVTPFDYGAPLLRQLRAAAGNGAGATDAFDHAAKLPIVAKAPAAASTIVVGPGDYGIEQFQLMTPKRDRVGGP